MLALSQNVDKELYFIYGLIILVILLIITIIIIDRIDSKKEKERSRKKLSDTLSMKPIKEENIIDNKYDDVVSDKMEVKKPKIVLEKKIKPVETQPVVEEKIEEEKEIEEEPYVETELEKTQAQIRVEEITKALKDAGVDKEEDFSKYQEFEEEQEKNAFISYEDLMNNFDRLYEENEKNQYIDDNSIPINIRELYELSKEEKKETIEPEDDNSFRRSPYISPVYGIQRAPGERIIDRDIENGNKFLNNLKELKSNLE